MFVGHTIDVFVTARFLAGLKVYVALSDIVCRVTGQTSNMAYTFPGRDQHCFAFVDVCLGVIWGDGADMQRLVSVSRSRPCHRSPPHIKCIQIMHVIDAEYIVHRF